MLNRLPVRSKFHKTSGFISSLLYFVQETGDYSLDLLSEEEEILLAIISKFDHVSIPCTFLEVKDTTNPVARPPRRNRLASLRSPPILVPSPPPMLMGRVNHFLQPQDFLSYIYYIKSPIW